MPANYMGDVRPGKSLWNMTTLTAKHLLVIDNYFSNGRNKSRAMMDAGYAENSAKQNASSLFKNRAMVTEIMRREKELRERFQIDREWIVERLARIADSGKTLAKFKKVDKSGGLYWDFSGATPEDLEIIESLTVDEYSEGRGPGAADVKKTKIKAQSPQAALDSLARILGLNTDRLKVEGDLTVVEQLQAGRQRISKLRHPPTNAVDAEFSELAQLPAPKEEESDGMEEAQPAVEEWDDDTIPW